MLEGETGFVVGGGDEDALVRRIGQLLDDPDLAVRMGAAGRQWVLERWGWQRSADRLRLLLDRRDPELVEGRL